ncbi:(deoxy)nucleoside triphosphate pyrophosphohydrolase [Desulfoluna spongiiphila]|uniref:8-oxo-dGTP diphosphatase n=1 Tax=Desulfoluna spongiiphila TaxID=419481 RepID=A0A1G5C4W0_9BACT|nr:(deoxy)nucleoside triphosphate pyrophosphohydrolase [Desulfoluna spongiiphila]SCX97367.1 8-oxo-dGTP diphosphatase [Desulfoluna spongiiphila]
MLTVAAALIRKEDKILVARHRPGTRHAGRWEFPGGKVEAGETPEEAIVREIQEELGILTTVSAFFGESIAHTETSDIRLLVFELAWDSGDLAPTDHDRIDWVRPEDLLSYDLLEPDQPIARQYMDREEPQAS